MAIDLGTVMDAIGVQLATISGLRVFDFPPTSAEPPFAFVDMPTTLDYDLTMGRGSDRIQIRVFVGVSNQVDRSARDALATLCAASGSGSVKAAIEAKTAGVPNVLSSARVTRAEFGPLVLSAGTYMGAVFFIDVAA